jgi:SET domain-containing protein
VYMPTLNLLNAYLPQSWVDPRLAVRRSPISGLGLFAQMSIMAGEVVVIWGGRLFSADDIQAGIPRIQSLAMIDADFSLGSLPHEPITPDEYMNHSCEPNVWLQDAVTLIARRAILAGEELTIDYALWEADPEWSMPCRCGSRLCRGVNTGEDWRCADLQLRYQGHFSPYVAQLIRRAGRKNGISA